MTTGERHRLIEEVFHAALAREADERAEFLAQACANDSSLRAEIERLLDAAASDTFLETPPILDFDPQLSETDVDPKPEARIKPGETLHGRWVVGEELARGGIGAVYLARDTRLLNKTVVVKTLLDESLQNEWKVKKFKHEMEALTRVEHHGVVGVLDAGQTPDGTPFLVMQYVEGVTLASAIGSGGMEHLRRAAQLIRQIGQALNAAHEVGVIHRDLKPGNVMLRHAGSGDEEVKLIDFGIAKVINPQATTATGTSLVVGSLAYMAPEQLRAEPLDAASDIYALGVIAYELVTGRKPFEPASPFQLLEMQRTGVSVPPRDLRPDLPEAAQALMLRALSFQREDRPQNAREFGEALALALTGTLSVESERIARTQGKRETVAAHSSPGASTRVRGRRALAFVAALLVALVAGALLFWQFRSPVVPRTLSYWIVVQKYRDGNPYKDAFRLPKEILFEEDDRMRVGVVSPQSGYLYIINEGPLSVGGRPDYNLLFPTPSANNGAALLAPGQPVTIPEEGRKPFRLDAQQGTEKLWLVYSEQSIAELEAVKGVVNAPQRGGEISDPAQAAAVQEFLRTHAASQPQVRNDAENRQTNVSVAGGVLVHLILLEHH